MGARKKSRPAELTQVPQEIIPQPGPQTDFLTTPVDFCLYGGMAGGGKTAALLMEPLRHANVEGFNAVIFRRTQPEIKNAGGLWDESLKFYSGLARPTQNPFNWKFPGGRVSLRSIQYEADIESWQGSQICLLEFDELTTFTKKMILELLARNRSVCGVKPYCRATCNPDPYSWVMELVEWYLDEAGYPDPNKTGAIRYFTVLNDRFIWGAAPQEVKDKVPGLKANPMSFTFIPARLEDNKILMREDPGYEAKLEALPFARRAALRYGNWRTKYEGKLWKPNHFENRIKRSQLPQLSRVAVGVDPSGGHGARNDEQGIFGAGKSGNKVYLLKDATCKKTPGGWGQEVCDTYHLIKADKVYAEKNFGGEMVESTINNIDESVPVALVSASRGKAVRAEPVVALAEKGNLVLVDDDETGGPDEFAALISECLSFDPESPAQSPNRMDAMVWAVTGLTGNPNPAIIEFYKQEVEREKAEEEAKKKAEEEKSKKK